MNSAPPTPKGFRDIQTDLAKKRRGTIDKIVGVLDKNGFNPIETPTLEFAQTLEGKYGEEERLMYKFMDRGGRELALRYDLTVPLARYVATYNPPLPFRRYQIGQVFRGENPQKGRFREFTQLDFDTVGSTDLKEDAKIIGTAINSLDSLGFNNFKVLINDRHNLKFNGPGFELSPDENIIAVRAIDKLKKIGKDGVLDEMIKNGLAKVAAKFILQKAETIQPTQNLTDIFAFLKEMGIPQGKYEFTPTLARGLDYYTGMIFEIEVMGKESLSIGGGGRYDNLIGSFAKKDIPAVGFSFGLDRLLEILTTSSTD